MDNNSHTEPTNHWLKMVAEPTQPATPAETVSEAIRSSVIPEAQIEKRRPGRPALPPEERARRKKIQQEVNQKRQLARRKAMAILADRHNEEFETLLGEQMSEIENGATH